MCWFVNFKVNLMDKRGKAEVEERILAYKAKVAKKGIGKVPIIAGSMDEGFRTALHCDCDNVIGDGKSGQALLHYPELFESVIGMPAVKNIQVWWFWGKDEGERNEEKVTIKEFLEMNGGRRLRGGVVYRVLKDRYV